MDCIVLSIPELEDYIKKSKEGLITAGNNSIGNMSTNWKIMKTSKQKWEEKTASCIFVATIWWRCTRGEVYIATKGMS